MSGPKIDAVELERRRKERLERERLERLRRLKEASNRLLLTCERVRRTITEINSDLAYELTFCSDAIRDEVASAKSSAVPELEGIINISTVPATEDEILGLNEHIVNAFNTIYADTYLKRIKQLRQTVHEQHKKEAEDESQRAKFDFTRAIKEESVRPDDVSFCEDSFQTDAAQEIKNLLETIGALKNNDATSHHDLKLLSAVRSDLIQVIECDEFNIQTAVINEANMVIQSVQSHTALFNSLYSDYFAEYNLFVQEVNKCYKNKLPILPKEKTAFQSIDMLQTELSKLRVRARHLAQQNYIRQSINRVLSKFKFLPCEELVFDAAANGRHFISKYNDDKSSALHVYLGDQNHFMMEFVGTEEGHENRVIGADELSPAEAAGMLEKQNAFCKIHPLITKELENLGIRFTPVQHSQPALNFCKKVICSVSGDAEIADNLINTKRRSSANTNTLYKYIHVNNDER